MRQSAAKYQNKQAIIEALIKVQRLVERRRLFKDRSGGNFKIIIIILWI